MVHAMDSTTPLSPADILAITKAASEAASEAILARLTSILQIIDDLVRVNEALCDRITELEWMVGIEGDDEKDEARPGSN